MNILFFNYEYPPLGGGAGQATKSLFSEFSKRPDIRVDLVTSSVDGQFHRDTVGTNITIHRLPIGKNKNNLQYQSKKELLLYSWKAFWYGRRLCRTNAYDVVHAFFTVPCGVIAEELKHWYHVPYIVSLRGADVPGYADRFSIIYVFLRSYIKTTWKRAAHVVSNSKGLRELAIKTNPSQLITVIPNGIDSMQFSPGQRTSDDRQKEFRVLSASRLTKRKGIRYILEAIRELHESYPHVRLTIAGGDGDATKELHHLVNKHLLHDVVSFAGPYGRDYAPELFQSHDVFVLPSQNEGMSNSLLEAMASGLPVLMTPTGGAQELITPGENGFLLEFKDSKSIEVGLRSLLEDDGLVQSMGETSREKAESMSWEHVADSYIELYKELENRN